jgi:hypothetical protein
VISTKAAAGDAKAAVEGYVKAAQSFAKEAEGHSKVFSSKLQGRFSSVALLRTNSTPKFC